MKTRLTVLFLAAVAVTAASSAVGLAAPETRPKASLVLVSDDPVALRGSGFSARERVTVRLTVGERRVVKRLRATARGTFTARFTETRGECDPLGAIATGASGNRAQLARKFEIPPACGAVPQP